MEGRPASRLLLCWLLLVGGEAAASDLVILNTRVIDGTGAAPIEGVSILARDARIDQIAVEVAVIELRSRNASISQSCASAA